MTEIKYKSFSELAEYHAYIIPIFSLKNPAVGAMNRNRVFSKENTLWAFFSQMLDSDGECQEFFRKLPSGVSYGEFLKFYTIEKTLLIVF